MFCNSTRRTHCCIAIATLVMSVCHCVTLYIHCLSCWSKGKENAVTILKILDITHCIKFSCLGNQAPDKRVYLHDFEKRDQHFIYFGAVILAFFDQEDKLFPLGCYVFWLWDCSGITMAHHQWWYYSQHMVLFQFIQGIQILAFLFTIVSLNFGYCHLSDFEITDYNLANWFLVFI